MFKIVAEPTFTCEVLLSRPASDTPVPMDVTWKHQDTDQHVKWLAAAASRTDDAAFLGEVIVGWGRVLGEDDKPLPYSEAALRALLKAFPASPKELVQAYHARLTDARAKN